MTNASPENNEQLQQERWQLLTYIHTVAEVPLVVLSFVWLGLLILDFTVGLSPFLQILSTVIWAVFVLNFVLEILIAPHKITYIRRHWLSAISLLLPALRIFRIVRLIRVLRVARATRSLGLLRLVTSINRGMGALGKTLGRRGVGYILALTIIVTFAGAAGMYFFESPAATAGQGLDNYGEAVWWTAMIMTTMGSEYWPQTSEGRILSWLLSLYAFAIFGYITATIASYFIGQDKQTEQPTLKADEITALLEEMDALRKEISMLSAQLNEENTHHTTQRDQEQAARSADR